MKNSIMCNFINYKNIYNKDLLWINLKDFDFMPETYVINDKDDFDKVDSTKHGNNDIWYLKPTRMSQGKGIIVNKLNILKKQYPKRKIVKQNFVLQKEIKPHLIDCLKFSVRGYLFLMYDKFYFYHETALVFASEKYNNGVNLFSQITNASYNKKNSGYDKRVDLFSNHPKLYDEAFPKMSNILKTVAKNYKGKLATDKIILFGVDFLIDKQLNCLLLEINNNLAIITRGDQYKNIFYPLVKDMVYLYANHHNIELPKKCKQDNGWTKL